MASKTSLNDYSGLSTVFRDTTFGLLLSAGGLSTLLPNLIEGFSEVQSLGTFSALNAFSVIYFLFPILIFTCYWLLRGHRYYILEKLNEEERFDLQIHKEPKLADTKNTLLIYLVTVVKIGPLALFLFNQDFFSNSTFFGDYTHQIILFVIGALYFLIALAEVRVAKESNELMLYTISVH